MTTDRMLIKNGLVTTLERGEPEGGRTADILIEDGRILAIEADLHGVDAELIDASNMLVMPGFVDTHRHTWQTAFRGLASDWSLGQYGKAMHGTVKPNFGPDDIYIANLLGRIEALHGGITTMLDWSHGIITPDHADGALQGLADAPGRSIFAYCGNLRPPASNEPVEEEVRRFRTGPLASDDGLVTMALGLRGPQYSSLETTRRDVLLARELDLPVTVHGGSAAWGRNRPIARMHELGLLDARTTVVHCNTLADDELAMMADCGCTASISPDAEIQLGFGWPATGRLLAQGIHPSLSIDDCAAVCGDMFRTMHSTLLVQRGLDNERIADPTDQQGLSLTSRHVVEFATIEGARACGMADRIGTLAPGKCADLLLLNADDLSIFPLNHPLGQIVTAGHPGLIDTIIVAGRIVKRHGHWIGVDLDRVRSLALQSRERIMEAAIRDAADAGRITLGGSWNPSVEGFSADSMKPEG